MLGAGGRVKLWNELVVSADLFTALSVVWPAPSAGVVGVIRNLLAEVTTLRHFCNLKALLRLVGDIHIGCRIFFTENRSGIARRVFEVGLRLLG